jgi:hypothetical protein
MIKITFQEHMRRLRYRIEWLRMIRGSIPITTETGEFVGWL